METQHVNNIQEVKQTLLANIDPLKYFLMLFGLLLLISSFSIAV